MRLTKLGLAVITISLSVHVDGDGWTKDVSTATGLATRVATFEYADHAGGSARLNVREVTLPAGTRLAIVLEKAVGSDISRVEERVPAHISRAVRIGGVIAVPQGSRIDGVVTDATRPGKVKGRAHIGLRFESLAVSGGDGERYAIRTATVVRLAPATKKNDALKIGLPAAGGAVVGSLVGGKEGAAIGAAAGGGAGTAVVLSTRGKEVRLPRGTALSIRLTAPLTVRVRT